MFPTQNTSLHNLKHSTKVSVFFPLKIHHCILLNKYIQQGFSVFPTQNTSLHIFKQVYSTKFQCVSHSKYLVTLFDTSTFNKVSVCFPLKIPRYIILKKYIQQSFSVFPTQNTSLHNLIQVYSTKFQCVSHSKYLVA